jgi:basic membrane protein A and related proteins
MRRGKVRWFGLTALCAAVIAMAAGCGSSSNSNTGSSAASSGGSKGKAKVAIILTRPVSSAFGKPATDAASVIKQQFGNAVTVQGGVAQADVQRTLQGYATRGYGLIIIDGAEMQQQAQQVAPQFPKVKFVVVNGNASAKPNLASATYSWEQSGFLAGIAAGLTTKTDKASTMSSIKIPPIEGLYYGFQQGVKQVNPSAKTTNSYMGTNVPDTGLAANLTAAQGSQGYDVVFTVATAADPGVFRGAKQKNMLVVGYGTDETNLGPKAILTSSLVDYKGTMVNMTRLFNSGQLQPKVYTYGFKDHAFKLAPLTNVPKATADKINKLAQQAMAGKFKIKTLSATF